MEDASKSAKHFQTVELTNETRLEIASLMNQLREDGVLPNNINMGQFISLCYLRGLNEYRKDLNCFV
jgi:hypothetical protein